MPVGEIIRYASIATGKKYKVDVENERVILADPSIILDAQTTVKYDGLFEGTIEAENSEAQAALKKKLESMGISFGAGSDLKIENGQLFITNSETNHARLKELRDSLK